MRDRSSKVFEWSIPLRRSRSYSMGLPVAACWLLAAVLSVSPAAADGIRWPRWRGPADNAVVGQALPVAWSDTSNVAWKVAMPGRGCSTPVVWDGILVLTAPVDGRDAALSFDLQGRELWRTPFGEERPGKHKSASGCNPSPVTDGRSVWVYFKSGTLAALSLDGKVLWKTSIPERFGPDALVWDIGTSPVLTEKAVVINIMNGPNSHLAAYDRGTGKLRWGVPRNYPCKFEADQGYTTPIVLPFAGRESLLVWNAEHLTVHDAADGATLWNCGGLNPEGKSNWPPVSSPLVMGDTVIVPYGRGKLLHGLRLAGRGDVTGKALLWSRGDTGSYVPTPLAYKGKVILLRDRNEVECVDPATGRTEWTGEFETSGTPFYASPVIAAGRLYVVREDGVAFVAKIDGGFEVLARNVMNEKMWATPVPLGGRMLLRGEKTLFCIGAP